MVAPTPASSDTGRNESFSEQPAARRRLANRGLRDVIAEWERERGAFSETELAAARLRVEG